MGGRRGWGLPGLSSPLPRSCSGTSGRGPSLALPSLMLRELGALPPVPPVHLSSGSAGPLDLPGRLTRVGFPIQWPRDQQGVGRPRRDARHPAGGGLGGWLSRAESRRQRPCARGRFQLGRPCLGPQPHWARMLCRPPRPVRAGAPGQVSVLSGSLQQDVAQVLKGTSPRRTPWGRASGLTACLA